VCACGAVICYEERVTKKEWFRFTRMIWHKIENNPCYLILNDDDDDGGGGGGNGGGGDDGGTAW